VSTSYSAEPAFADGEVVGSWPPGRLDVDHDGHLLAVAQEKTRHDGRRPSRCRRAEGVELAALAAEDDLKAAMGLAGAGQTSDIAWVNLAKSASRSRVRDRRRWTGPQRCRARVAPGFRRRQVGAVGDRQDGQLTVSLRRRLVLGEPEPGRRRRTARDGQAAQAVGKSMAAKRGLNITPRGAEKLRM